MEIKKYLSPFLNREFIKFLAVGLFNTIFGYSIYFALIYFFKAHYSVALVSEYLITIVVSYLGNRLWVFKSKGASHKEFGKYIGVYLISILANYLLLILAVDILKYSELLSQLIILMVLAAISFIGHKKWTFAK